MKTIAFDIDGTVVDVWDRYWGIYAQCLEARDAVPLPQGSYRRAVRKGIENFRIFDQRHDGRLYREFLAFRSTRLEAFEYLQRDRVVSGMAAALGHLATRYRLIAVSSRDEAACLRRQLAHVGLAPFFAAIHATRLHGGAAAKAEVLQREDAALMVGDTEIDLQAAATAGINAVPVAWGLRNAAFLGLNSDMAVVRSPRRMVDACHGLCARRPRRRLPGAA